MSRFSVTYDVVTPESVVDGDVAEPGFASPGGWKHSDRARMSLREAISAAGFRHYSRKYGAGFEDGGRAWYTVDPDVDYRTGEDTRYAIHPPENITASSYRRVTRILCGRP
jgi:hypothetical protein